MRPESEAEPVDIRFVAPELEALVCIASAATLNALATAMMLLYERTHAAATRFAWSPPHSCRPGTFPAPGVSFSPTWHWPASRRPMTRLRASSSCSPRTGYAAVSTTCA